MKKVNNNITELVFIIDRSGSMGGLESDTIGGFNSLVEKQKKQSGECFVTTVLFDNVVETIHDRIELKDVQKLSEEEYYVRGCTALTDAVGESVEHIEKIHRYVRAEDVPEHTMFVIITDGMENASHRYSGRQVKKMIEKHKEKDGWEFLFIGANIDAVSTAKDFGIDEDRAVDYRADRKGTSVVYRAMEKAVGCVRASAPLRKSWSDEIKEDYKSRGN